MVPVVGGKPPEVVLTELSILSVIRCFLLTCERAFSVLQWFTGAPTKPIRTSSVTFNLKTLSRKITCECHRHRICWEERKKIIKLNIAQIATSLIRKFRGTPCHTEKPEKSISWQCK